MTFNVAHINLYNDILQLCKQFLIKLDYKDDKRVTYVSSERLTFLDKEKCVVTRYEKGYGLKKDGMAQYRWKNNSKQRVVLEIFKRNRSRNVTTVPLWTT